jgi:hypothetical protein
MWQYLAYFVIGSTVVATVAYVGTHYGGLAAAFVASLPIVFLVSLTLLYRNGGVNVSLQHIKGSLLFLPVFALYAALTARLLPRLGTLAGMVPGLALYIVPLVALREARQHGVHPRQGSKDGSLSVVSQHLDGGTGQ